MSRFSSNTRTSVSRQPITRIQVPFSQRDLLVEAVLGNIGDVVSVNKFGCATNIDNDVPTDIWNRANASDNQAIWIAPTQARVHDLVSDNAADVNGGAGMRSALIQGLRTWDSKETSQILAMNGTTPVVTEDYVIIHRVVALSYGASGPNVGTITVTAQVDDTVTAQIEPGKGQTSMLIYGLPSVNAFLVTQVYAYALQGAANADVGMSGLINQRVPSQLEGFVTTFEFSLKPQTGVPIIHPVSVPTLIQGPAIMKFQALSDAQNVGVAAGFDGLLTDIGRVNRTKIRQEPPPPP